MTEPRKCANEFCDNDMSHKRAGALYCCEGCAREMNTIKALRRGRASAGYRTLSEYLGRARRRGTQRVA